MELELGEVVEGVGAVELAGINNAHVEIARVCAVIGLVEERIFPVQDRHLERPFADVIVQGGSRLTKEERQLYPVLEHVVDGLAQA